MQVAMLRTADAVPARGLRILVERPHVRINLVTGSIQIDGAHMERLVQISDEVRQQE
jgi:hypothetical protein